MLWNGQARLKKLNNWVVNCSFNLNTDSNSLIDTFYTKHDQNKGY